MEKENIATKNWIAEAHEASKAFEARYNAAKKEFLEVIREAEKLKKLRLDSVEIRRENSSEISDLVLNYKPKSQSAAPLPS